MYFNQTFIFSIKFLTWLKIHIYLRWHFIWLIKILTFLLFISFISHVRITREDLEITLSTMRLTAKIAKLKPIKTIRHIQPQTELIVQQLQEQVNTLKKELELNDMFLHQEALPNISKARFEQISQDVINFLQGFISELTLFNVTQARILVNVVKQLYDKFVPLILFILDQNSNYVSWLYFN